MRQARSERFAHRRIAVNKKILVVAAVVLVAVSLPASAQVNLDMNKITCGDWLGYDPESQNFVRFFMSGYYNASRGSNVLDYSRLQRNSQKVLAYCKKHRSETLPTAIQKLAI
jgi:acid stress chaperone HdeB